MNIERSLTLIIECSIDVLNHKIAPDSRRQIDNRLCPFPNITSFMSGSAHKQLKINGLRLCHSLDPASAVGARYACSASSGTRDRLKAPAVPAAPIPRHGD